MLPQEEIYPEGILFKARNMMKRKKFIQSMALLSGAPFLLKANSLTMKESDAIQLVRHATLIVTINGKRILVDPMLSAKDEMDPVGNCGNEIRIPMVELPFGMDRLKSILSEVDALLITHLHRDHWDAAAQKLIDQGMLIFCQPSDESKLRDMGFVNTKPIRDQISWDGLTISRTDGKHGTGEIGQRMGAVSGFVLNDGSQSIYIAGDTIWCDEVKAALEKYKPDVTVLNGGGAQFLSGDPITMTAGDIMKVHQHSSATKIIAVHMDTVNHCFVKRSDLAKVVAENNATSAILIPLDGEVIEIA